MSTTKTMGTNPLTNSHIEEETLTFIPDRRKNQQRMNHPTKQRNRNRFKKHKGKRSNRISHSNGSRSNSNGSMNSDKSKKSEKTEKKIASYSLDVELLQQVRKLAQKQDRYYSSIVSEALENLIQQYTNSYGEI